ncbi:hypothetical protein D9M68_910810 [compost metagenome]
MRTTALFFDLMEDRFASGIVVRIDDHVVAAGLAQRGEELLRVVCDVIFLRRHGMEHRDTV